jgi:hypothetical protein
MMVKGFPPSFWVNFLTHILYAFFPKINKALSRKKEGKDEYMEELLLPPPPHLTVRLWDTQFSSGLSAPFWRS